MGTTERERKGNSRKVRKRNKKPMGPHWPIGTTTTTTLLKCPVCRGCLTLGVCYHDANPEWCEVMSGIMCTEGLVVLADADVGFDGVRAAPSDLTALHFASLLAVVTLLLS